MEKPITTQEILAEFDERFTEANPGWRETGFTGETIMKDSVYPGQLKKFITNSISQVLESLRMEEQSMIGDLHCNCDEVSCDCGFSQTEGFNIAIQQLDLKIDQIIQGK